MCHLYCREEERRWRAEDLEQRALDNARQLWARFVEKNRCMPIFGCATLLHVMSLQRQNVIKPVHAVRQTRCQYARHNWTALLMA